MVATPASNVKQAGRYQPAQRRRRIRRRRRATASAARQGVHPEHSLWPSPPSTCSRPASTPRGNSTYGARSAARLKAPPPRSRCRIDARRNTLLTSLAELARDYIQLRGLQESERIVRNNLSHRQPGRPPHRRAGPRRLGHRPRPRLTPAPRLEATAANAAATRGPGQLQSINAISLSC